METNGSDSAMAELESITVARAATVQAMSAIECTKCPAQVTATKWAKQAKFALEMAEMSLKGRMGFPGMLPPKSDICGFYSQEQQTKRGNALGQMSIPRGRLMARVFRGKAHSAEQECHFSEQCLSPAIPQREFKWSHFKAISSHQTGIRSRQFAVPPSRSIAFSVPPKSLTFSDPPFFPKSTTKT